MRVGSGLNAKKEKRKQFFGCFRFLGLQGIFKHPRHLQKTLKFFGLEPLGHQRWKQGL